MSLIYHWLHIPSLVVMVNKLHFGSKKHQNTTVFDFCSLSAEDEQ